MKAWNIILLSHSPCSRDSQTCWQGHTVYIVTDPVSFPSLSLALTTDSLLNLEYNVTLSGIVLAAIRSLGIVLQKIYIFSISLTFEGYFMLLWPETDRIDRPQIYCYRYILIYWFWSFVTPKLLNQYWPQKLHNGQAAVVPPKRITSL